MAVPFSKGTTLDDVATRAAEGLKQGDADIQTALAEIGSGSSISIQDMVKLQYTMSRYTITASTFSSILKEFSDTMKSVVQKIS
jgi:hypothetical protein